MPTMTVLSPTMRKLRREGIEIRRRMAGVASTGGGIAKKRAHQPTSQLYSPLPRRCCNPAPGAPPAPRRADGDNCSDGARLERAAAAAMNKCFAKGAQVRVRTRVGTVCTGQTLVLWLLAVVESAADEDGYLRVAYSFSDGKLPRVARVSPSDVKPHVTPVDVSSAAEPAHTGGSSTVTSDHSARPSSQSQQGKAVPRPTVAGKKLSLLKELGLLSRPGC